MISRIDQQIKVNKIMLDYIIDKKAEISKQKKLRTYMVNYLEIITVISSVLLIRSGTEENRRKKELWIVSKKNSLLYMRCAMVLWVIR